MKMKWITAVLALCSLTSEAYAARSSVKSICTSLNDQTLTVSVKSRCLRSGKRTDHNSLAVDVDQSTATIRINGDFTVEYGYHIGPADCMGSTQFELQANDIKPRRYTLLFGNRHLGQVDFTETLNQKPCFRVLAGAGEHPLVRERDFATWSQDMVTDWRNWTGDDLPNLVRPLIGSFPDIMEGSPKFSLSAERSRWVPSVVKKPFPLHRQYQQVMTVRLTQNGLSDDSVTAMRFVGIAKLGPEGWFFHRLYSQAMCARGSNAGQWIAAPCP